jgi:serine/threonine-protein kinase
LLVLAATALAVLPILAIESGLSPKPWEWTRPVRPGIVEQVEHWARQGFHRDEASGKTDGWPNVLLSGEDRVRFRRVSGGIYLPEGYTPSRELAEDGYPRTLTRKDDGTIFIRIVEGTFTMGRIDGAVDDVPGISDHPGYPVQLSGFYMQQTEVTNGEIVRHLAEMGAPAACREWVERFSRLKTYLHGDEEQARKHPAGDIPWHIAKLYAGKRGGRLPTEAQWEFAARSQGENYRHVWAFQEKQAELQVPLMSRANINTFGDTKEGTAAVGRYPLDVTVQGIFDLTGNVREWCRDVWRPSPVNRQTVVGHDPDRGPSPDGDARAEDKRVVRGGSFMTSLEFGETINRDEPHPPDYVTDDIGFRIVIECPEIRRDAR